MKENINLLYEMSSLRNVPRLWAQVLGKTVQNNIEHTFRVMMTALMISRMEGKGDEGKILKIALFHDICEARSVDIAFLHRQYVERHEDLASEHQLKGTVFEDMLEILSEYKVRQSIESHIVKDADDLEVDMELRELGRFGNEPAQVMMKNNRPYIREKLYTESAKKLWDEIYNTEPDEWQRVITHNWTMTRKSGEGKK
jgi:5'-deoxynucleotidase YfbR-like HD superfamily hydrolase